MGVMPRTFRMPSPAIDVLTDEYVLEVKHRRGITIAQVEAWLAHNAAKAKGRGLKNALIVKRKAGPGRATPYLAIFPLTEGEPDA